MQEIRDYLKQNVLVADGAAGTYLSSLAGRSADACERFNLTAPLLVERMHREYAAAGSRLLLTNTFCANSRSLGLSFDTVGEIIRAGVRIARRAAGGKCYVAADIGPVPEDGYSGEEVFEEYRKIADVFLSEGVKIFVFETFSDAKSPLQAAAYIRSKAPDAFLLISFAVTPDGYSRMGLRADALIGEVVASGIADAAGFNCCSGPAHLLRLASSIDFGGLIPSVMPNAGYPENEEGRLIYAGSPDYFGEKLAEGADAGFRILGGCCGTTPEHIRRLGLFLSGKRPAFQRPESGFLRQKPAGDAANPFYTSAASDQKTLVVELDPPFDSDLKKLEEAARAVAAAGADAVTVADSPMARARADSVMVAAYLRRTAGIEAIPHLCCRDKNLNALKSTLIGAHLEGIRNVLAVTGDPISETDRSYVKSVFNLNSAGLCGFIRDLNSDIFRGDPVRSGCAFNSNARNVGEELGRLSKKIQAGASFVMTQPVFSEDSVNALKQAAQKGVPVFAGVLTPLSYRNARFLANEIPGFVLPDSVLGRFYPEMTREEGEEAGIALSLETIAKVAPYVKGFYFMTPFNRVTVTARLIGRMRESGLI